MARLADATPANRLAAASRQDASASRLSPGERAIHLEELASRIERSESADRGIDVDIYEALGFVVRRKLAHHTSRRSPAGGIYQQGTQWRSVGRISSDVSVAVEIVERLYPRVGWSLHFDADRTPESFRATVADSEGLAADAARALCAAILRAAARTNPPRGPSGFRALSAITQTTSRQD
jgi:hypothetical protein